MAKKTTRQPVKTFEQEQGEGIVPTMNGVVAEVFAKLLHIGCPPVRAVLYVAPLLDIDTAKATAKQWMSDRLVLEAHDVLIGGSWKDLPAEKRFELALEKQYAEAAFYIWTVNFSDIEHEIGLKKMKEARELLRFKLTGKADDENDPMGAFARLAMELAKNAQATSDSRKKKVPVAKDDVLDMDVATLRKM